MKVFLLVALALMAVAVESKTFSRCGLVQELRRQKFPTSQLRHWVCLIEAESSRRTHVVGPPNSDGSRDYGLFQINSRYWCSTTNSPGKDCNVRCSDLVTDNITRASACAKKIFQRHGFRAWYGWRSRCQGTLPNISSC